MAVSLFFVPSAAVPIKLAHRKANAFIQPSRPLTSRRKRTRYHDKIVACTTTPVESVDSDAEEAVPSLSEEALQTVLRGTMLESEPLAEAYTSKRDGFDNVAFFDRLTPLGGVPSLVLGETSTGVRFGGYAASGFLARDDYREATNPRSMFVFRVLESDEVLFAEPTDLVQYDFYDYAIRLGAALLGVPMNPDKHIMKENVGTSSCRLPNGESSVFGDATLAKIITLQVWVAQKYMQEIEQRTDQNQKGFFARLFS